MEVIDFKSFMVFSSSDFKKDNKNCPIKYYWTQAGIGELSAFGLSPLPSTGDEVKSWMLNTLANAVAAGGDLEL